RLAYGLRHGFRRGRGGGFTSRLRRTRSPTQELVALTTQLVDLRLDRPARFRVEVRRLEALGEPCDPLVDLPDSRLDLGRTGRGLRDFLGLRQRALGLLDDLLRRTFGFGAAPRPRRLLARD